MNIVTPKPAGSYWSDDQWEAIALSGGNMLVAAAAGSGKTAVLVERIIRKITSADHPVDIQRLMVATFTKAAATEMRQRIREALEEALGRDGENGRVQRQLAMLGRATIMTLHSFCMEVIQRYYTVIPLDPGFRIASEHEARLLRQEVLEELFEDQYGAEELAPSAFSELAEWFGGERGDEALLRLTLRLYDFSRSHPWPDYWLRSMAMSFEETNEQTLEDSVWIQSIRQDTLLTLDGILNLLMQAKALSLSPGGPAPYVATLEEDLNLVLGLRESVEHGSWSSLYDVFQSAVFGKLKAVRKEQADPAVQEKVKSYRDEAKKALTGLRQQLFGRPASAFAEELRQAAPLMKELAELVIRFGQRYSAEKAARGWLDFSDLEHYCLRILLHPGSTPLNILPSDAALEYQAQFEEVLLDEYQDTNSVQETIIELISRGDRGNRFMVGDVKQSIYRFRLAEPGLFLSKYRSYGGDFDGEGRRIDLAQNFRSRREVVGAVNMLFRQIMNAAVAEIDYDRRAELVYGDLFPAHEQGLPQYGPELLLIDRSGSLSGTGTGVASSAQSSAVSSEDADNGGAGEDGGNEEESAAELEAVQLEARAIAARIRGLLGEGGAPLMVYDKNLKASRPAVYGDIVILLRATSVWAPLFIQELQMEGIPASGELSQGYFQASEVEILLSLLQIIDNPRQDIPLVSVLRSPIVGLDEEQLARLRLGDKAGSFYEAMTAWYSQIQARGQAADGNKASDGEDSQAADDSQIAEDGQAAAAPDIVDALDSQSSDESGKSGKTAGTRPLEAEDLDELLYNRLENFLSRLDRWREIAREGKLGFLIWSILEESLYLDWVGGLPGGPQRQANLNALYGRAVQFERTSASPGLFGFLRFIEKLKENGGDFGAPASGGQEQESVQIMTIHKSKGLEFPVVFVAGLSKLFNKQDLNTPFLVHKELGFGPKFIDAATRASYPTLPNLAIRGRSRLELIAEEMRILYVALTRPKDKLIMVSAVKDLKQSAAAWSQSLSSPGEVLPDYLLARARSFMDWIGPALIRHPSAGLLRELAGEGALSPSPGLRLLEHREDSPDWHITVLPAQEIALAAAVGRESSLLPAGRGSEAVKRLLAGHLPASEDRQRAEGGIGSEVEQRLSWEYPHATASRVAAKTSVTELKSLLTSEREPAAVSALEAESIRRERSSGENEFEFQLHLRRPKFMERRALSPTERGTAYHTVMQHLPLENRSSVPAAALVESTLAKLAERRILAPEVIAELDASVITAFLDGPLGKLLQHASWIKRELPFTYAMPAGEAFPHFSPALEEIDEETAAKQNAKWSLQPVEQQGSRQDPQQGVRQDEPRNRLQEVQQGSRQELVRENRIKRELAGETVLVQGIVDCLFFVDGKQILLDYKSDRVLEPKGGLEPLKERYRIQLELYSKAIEEITGLPVAEKWLYFFDAGEAVRV